MPPKPPKGPQLHLVDTPTSPPPPPKSPWNQWLLPAAFLVIAGVSGAVGYLLKENSSSVPVPEKSPTQSTGLPPNMTNEEIKKIGRERASEELEVHYERRFGPIDPAKVVEIAKLFPDFEKFCVSLEALPLKTKDLTEKQRQEIFDILLNYLGVDKNMHEMEYFSGSTFLVSNKNDLSAVIYGMWDEERWELSGKIFLYIGSKETRIKVDTDKGQYAINKESDGTTVLGFADAGTKEERAVQKSPEGKVMAGFIKSPDETKGRRFYVDSESRLQSMSSFFVSPASIR